MSESKLDLSFLSSLGQKPKNDIQKELLLGTAMGMVGNLEDMVGQFNTNLNKGLNDKLATGNCFIRDEILFIREDGEDGEERAIWFPKGNALEYQRDNGLISKETADKIIPAAAKLQKLVDDHDKDEGAPA